MFRIHIVQMFYNPAFYEPPIDYLEEPCGLSLEHTGLGRLRADKSIADFLENTKNRYLAHLRAKITSLLGWSAQRKATIVVFPEYSIPFQLLPDLSAIAQRSDFVLCTGTHRVPASDAAKTIYRTVAPRQQITLGAAYAPIFLPDGSSVFLPKVKKSKWEPNLIIPDRAQRSFPFQHEGETVRIAVLPCIDSLNLESIGGLWEAPNQKPDLVLCPSLSPSTSPFQDIGAPFNSHGVPFVYANSALYGGSFINIPARWKQLLSGAPSAVDQLPKGAEGILEVDIDPKSFFEKRAVISGAPSATHPVAFPIIYSSSSPWSEELLKLGDLVIHALEAGQPATAIEPLETFLADYGALIPPLLNANLKAVLYSILPLYDGNLESARVSMQTVLLPRDILDTMLFWSDQVGSAVQLLTDYIRVTREDPTTALSCLEALKKCQQQLPDRQLDSGTQEPSIPSDRDASSPIFAGEEDLFEAFQNRGKDLDQIGMLLSNQNNPLILITGGLGIGKSEFLNWIFRKQFTDWLFVKVSVASGSSIARVIAELAFRLGVQLDIDSLGSASHNVFRQKVRAILRSFYSRSKRVLVIDDLFEILRSGDARIHRQVQIFLEEAADPKEFSGGRVIIVSTTWLPDKWVHQKGAAHLQLRKLHARFVPRIIEFQLRKAGLIKTETPPELPQALIDAVGGHPLSAKLAADALRSLDVQALTADVVGRVEGHIARELLKHVKLSSTEHYVMQRLSVFRLALRLELIRDIDEFKNKQRELSELTNRCILNFDGRLIEMHEAIRRYFYGKLVDKKATTDAHRIAVSYYERVRGEGVSAGPRDPGVLAELAHHLAFLGEHSRVRDLSLMIVEEIEPAARRVYKEERDWDKALKLYRLIADIAPNRPQVWAYIGRCNARRNRWNESDEAFETAIGAAHKTGQPVWWLHRDWGHIRARFGYYPEAKTHLDEAAKSHPDDPSIKGTFGFMYWRQGNVKEAISSFEEALKIDPYHGYSLKYYADLLEKQGERAYAETLRSRMRELDEGLYAEPADYDIEADADD